MLPKVVNLIYESADADFPGTKPHQQGSWQLSLLRSKSVIVLYASSFDKVGTATVDIVGVGVDKLAVTDIAVDIADLLGVDVGKETSIWFPAGVQAPTVSKIAMINR